MEGERNIITQTNIGNNHILKVLGLENSVPLSYDEMLTSLTATFYITNNISEKHLQLLNDVQKTLIEVGVKIIPFEDSLNENGKVHPNIVIFTAGVDSEKDLAINHVSSLYKNPIAGIFDIPCPVKKESTNQEKLDSIVSVLAREIVHIAVFANGENWTICTMNGAVIPFNYIQQGKDFFYKKLVPKLTAQVMPPDILCDITYRDNEFNPFRGEFTALIEDLSASAKVLKSNGVIMSHKSLDDLNFKSKFHERIARKYLDERTGMSYGFLVGQLPVRVKPAIKLDGNDVDYALEQNQIRIDFTSSSYILDIPDVWVLSTRSGCDKENIDVSCDIVRMGLVKGKIIFDKTLTCTKVVDCKPSYDTLSILAHALGNAFVASILKVEIGENKFTTALETTGSTLFHWHGYLEQSQITKGLYLHGSSNPGVSCSTAQSAVFSITGKLQALESCLEEGGEFLGDVHIEPHHGTNFSSILPMQEVIEKYILN